MTQLIKCLQNWRVSGPPFVRLSRSIRYEVSALEALVQEGVRHSTSDPSPALPAKPEIRVERFLEKNRADAQAVEGGALPARKTAGILPACLRHAYTADSAHTRRPE